MKHMREINNIEASSFPTIIFVLMVFAFYPLGGFSEFVGYTGSIISIGYRVFVVIAAVLAMILLQYEKLSMFQKSSLSYFIAFSIIYFIRISYDVIKHSDQLAFPISHYFISFIFICIIPALSTLFFIRYLKFDDFVYTFFILAIILFISSIFNFSTISMAQAISGGRMVTEKVNPIALGHFSGSLIITVFVALISKNCLIKKTWLYIFLFTSAVFLILAGSRGAVVSILVTFFCYYLLSGRLNIKNIIILLLGIFTAVYFTYLLSGAFFPDRDLFNGFINMGAADDMAANTRYGSFDGALFQFTENPILGDFIEERSTGFYPHNITLEVLMSTGFVGFIIFGLFFWNVFAAAFNALRGSGLKLLFSLLLIKTFIAAQFSGSIYNSAELWLFAVAIVVINDHVDSCNILEK